MIASATLAVWGVGGATVGPHQRRHRRRRRKGVHRLEVRDDGRGRAHQRSDQRIEDVDPGGSQSRRGVELLAQHPQSLTLVRPREGEVVDSGSVALVGLPGARAHHEVELLAVLETRRHLRDHPGPEPVRAGGVSGIVGEEVDRDPHRLRRHGQRPRRRTSSTVGRTAPGGACRPGGRPRRCRSCGRRHGSRRWPGNGPARRRNP